MLLVSQDRKKKTKRGADWTVSRAQCRESVQTHADFLSKLTFSSPQI